MSAEKVVEYLCFACGLQGMRKVRVSPTDASDHGQEGILFCPRCGSRASTFDFRLNPGPTAIVEA